MKLNIFQSSRGSDRTAATAITVYGGHNVLGDHRELLIGSQVFEISKVLCAKSGPLLKPTKIGRVDYLLSMYQSN